MATPRTWLPRADEILDVLRHMKSHALDRPAIEELFQLQRRAAITLMQQAGATGEKGKPWEIERTSLLSWVESVIREESWQLERRRVAQEELSQSMAEVQAVREALVRANRKPVSFPLVEEVLGANCSSLPPNVSLTPGCITIHLTDDEAATQACQLLYQLGIAIANDFDGFTRRVTAALRADLHATL